MFNLVLHLLYPWYPEYSSPPCLRENRKSIFSLPPLALSDTSPTTVLPQGRSLRDWYGCYSEPKPPTFLSLWTSPVFLDPQQHHLFKVNNIIYCISWAFFSTRTVFKSYNYIYFKWKHSIIIIGTASLSCNPTQK